MHQEDQSPILKRSNMIWHFLHTCSNVTVGSGTPFFVRSQRCNASGRPKSNPEKKQLYESQLNGNIPGEVGMVHRLSAAVLAQFKP